MFCRFSFSKVFILSVQYHSELLTLHSNTFLSLKCHSECVHVCDNFLYDQMITEEPAAVLLPTTRSQVWCVCVCVFLSVKFHSTLDSCSVMFIPLLMQLAYFHRKEELLTLSIFKCRYPRMMIRRKSMIYLWIIIRITNTQS